MSKYLDDPIIDDITNAVSKVIQIRNDIYSKYEVDIIENDTISLTTFYSIIQTINPTYRCNYSKNGEDGKIIIGNMEKDVESKTTKIIKGKAAFAFHAKGIINHDVYIFNVWCKKTLKPLRCYFVKNQKNVDIINEELDRLSTEWQKKPSTKAGYDVIRIKETMLEKLVESTTILDNCKVFHL